MLGPAKEAENMIIVTGATGQLGRHVVEELLEHVPASQIAVLARDPARAEAFAQRGVAVRAADYAKPETLPAALAGASKLLLISSSEVGERQDQHRAVIDAAKRAGVGFIAYTSILRADRSPLALATEHRATEDMLKASGIPFALLRNGWYFENYTAQLPVVLSHDAFIGSAGTGRIAAASRADFAAAAVRVLTSDVPSGTVYELAGDEPFTMAELAAEVGRQVGRSIAYHDLPAADYQKALEAAGLPAGFAAILADSDVGITQGALDAGTHQLRELIGRPTTTLHEAVSAALAKLRG
jgi:NAD(P)H dehydrogenase (quinone)